MRTRADAHRIRARSAISTSSSAICSGRLDLIGAEVLVTGHYARIEPGADGAMELWRATDRAKDQSYALALVPRAALQRAAFPLGAIPKDEVRSHAMRTGARGVGQARSQDLCFVPDGDYAGFAARTLGERRGTEPGPIEDAQGRRLGTHRGIFHYTVGQRRGLGLAAPEPLYVLAVEPERNALVVGGKHALEAEGLVTEPMNWLVSGFRMPRGA